MANPEGEERTPIFGGSGEGGKHPHVVSFFSLSKFTKAILAASMVGGYWVVGASFSVLPPIYPAEAESKGATPSQYGLVFGTSFLTALCATPFWTAWTGTIGPKRVLVGSIIVRSLAGGILFGLLHFVDSRKAFLGLSYALRCIFGVAAAAQMNSMMAVTVSLFPGRESTSVAVLETVFGLGYTIGPAFGSFVYEVGGYQLPFYLIGGLGLASGLGLALTLPGKIGAVSLKTEEDGTSPMTLSFWNAFCSPEIWFPFVDQVVINLGVGFVESMLEPHARSRAGMPRLEVGAVFLLWGLFYTLFTPIIGWVLDILKGPASKTALSLIANMLAALGMLILGPAALLPMEPSKLLIFMAAMAQGIATGVNFTATFSRSLSAAVQAGYRNEMGTHFIITGMWTWSYYTGAFVGPSLGGLSVEKFGFRFTCSAFFLLFALVTILDAAYIAWKCRQNVRSKLRMMPQKNTQGAST